MKIGYARKKFTAKILLLAFLMSTTLSMSTLSSAEFNLSSKVYSQTVLEPGIEQANYYVSPNGNDNYPGTITQPFKTIEKAVSVATSGNLIYIRGGVYWPKSPETSSGFSITNKKIIGAKLRIFNYPGEKPVFNCTGMTKNDGTVSGLAIDNCDNLHIKGIEIKNVPQNRNPTTSQGYYNIGLLVRSTNCIIENCTVHDIGGSGINVGGSSNNVVLKNCDAYNCFDPYTYSNQGQPYPGGNADGIHVTLTNNPSFVITIIGCRTWNCSDDGFDNFGTVGTINYENCWSWHNGYILGTSIPIGDGCGFKLGGTPTEYLTDVKRSLKNCIAAYNKLVGIQQNFDTGSPCFAINVNHCVSYKNLYGLGFGKGTAYDTIRNCISFDNTVGNSIANFGGHPNLVHDHNSFDTAGIIVNTDDFLSVDMSLLSSPRQANGDLPVINFLKLKAGSDLIGKGTAQSNIGLE